MPEIRFTDDELRSIQQEVVNNFEETFGRFRQWLNEDDMERIKALEASYRPLAKWENGTWEHSGRDTFCRSFV
jgi:hypothetical protein